MALLYCPDCGGITKLDYLIFLALRPPMPHRCAHCGAMWSVRLEAAVPDDEPPEVVRCETLFYAGLGEGRECGSEVAALEERECGDEAVALVDAGTPNESPVCAECARRYHPSRLTPIEK